MPKLTDEPTEKDPRHIEVAVPVPVRRVFSYRVPSALASRVQVGMRVLVPFGRRTMWGVVMRDCQVVDDQKRILPLAEVVESHVLFNHELLHFLERLARYYAHPLGEVLKLAAPSILRDDVKRLVHAGALTSARALPSVAHFKEPVVLVYRRLSAAKHLSRLGRRQAQLLDCFKQEEERTLRELRRHVPSARAVADALVERGLLERLTHKVPLHSSSPDSPSPGDIPPSPELGEDQAHALQHILSKIEEGGYHAALIHGVTGSGKTEVYLRAAAHVLAQGRDVLVLVPEIVLTPQLIRNFEMRLQFPAAAWHSGLSGPERRHMWELVRSGQRRLVIGARSAVFAPLPRLGLIVVDEEHDASYKQEEGFRYHGRDAALLRAFDARVPCVLGSATPSIEMYTAASQGRAHLLRMPQRVEKRPLPAVQVVDLRNHRSGPSGFRWISAPLERALGQCIARGEQAIILLNRRGYAQSLICGGCGQAVQCPACSVGLTEHRGEAMLRCHYCNYCAPLPDVCPECGRSGLTGTSVGTERIEMELHRALPAARLLRLDRDTAGGRRGIQVLKKFREHEADILIGTQMVAKGHDIPNVTLVGIILADQGLSLPDFRAAERTFQLLTQVAGRAGRGDIPGDVILQTYQPHHPVVAAVASADYQGYIEREARERKDFDYPPFSRMAMLRIEDADEERAHREAKDLASLLREARQEKLRVLGPAPAPIFRVRTRYRYRVVVLADTRRAMRYAVGVVASSLEKGRRSKVALDVDPVSML